MITATATIIHGRYHYSWAGRRAQGSIGNSSCISQPWEGVTTTGSQQMRDVKSCAREHTATALEGGKSKMRTQVWLLSLNTSVPEHAASPNYVVCVRKGWKILLGGFFPTSSKPSRTSSR